MSKYDPNFKSEKVYTIVGQKIIISNKNNEILLLQRSEKSGGGGKWSIPGGALENGENSEKGILREVEEETQITVNYPRPFYVRTYFNKSADFVVIIAYRAFYRGGQVILNWEHDQFKWVSKDAALSMNLTPDALDIIKRWQPKELLPEMTTDYPLNF